MRDQVATALGGQCSAEQAIGGTNPSSATGLVRESW